MSVSRFLNFSNIDFLSPGGRSLEYACITVRAGPCSPDFEGWFPSFENSNVEVDKQTRSTVSGDDTRTGGNKGRAGWQHVQKYQMQ